MAKAEIPLMAGTDTPLGYLTPGFSLHYELELMVESGENWNLVTTFNEMGEGTLVEASSANWGSDTKYGFYLDCLHEYH